MDRDGRGKEDGGNKNDRDHGRNELGGRVRESGRMVRFRRWKSEMAVKRAERKEGEGERTYSIPKDSFSYR